MTYRFAVLVPLMFTLIALVVLGVNYEQEFTHDLDTEYRHMTNDLDHTVKLLSAMNYTFATYFSNGTTVGSDTTQYTKVLSDDGLCTWTPTQKAIQSAYKSNSRLVLQLNYAAKGIGAACQPGTKTYEELKERMILAPPFSYLNKLERYILGFYYVSPNGFLIVAPAELADGLHQDTTSIVKTREYWKEAQNGVSEIRITGPVKDVSTKKNIITLSAGLFNGSTFQGVVILDIELAKLNRPDSQFVGRIQVINSHDNQIPHNVWMPTNLHIDGVKTDQIMYYEWHWSQELARFFQTEMSMLLIIFVMYLVAVATLIYVKINDESKHFRFLSQRDPMTSLLNRRGFEVAYKMVEGQKYEALAVFDIDDFKKVNDEFGHDVGDEVICAVAQCMNRNTRASDLVARFGGEEFVVYMQGSNAEKMIEAIERIHHEIQQSSTKVLAQGYTVSTGVTIKHTAEKHTLETLVKEADKKLYQAKEQGKNRVVI
ncbi:MAG: diguanylate cyclase [Vibrio sp.]